MKSKLMLLILVVGTAALFCGCFNRNTDDSDPPTVDVTGVWTLTIEGENPVVVTLEQTGNTVDGGGTDTERDEAVAVDGSVSGDLFALTITWLGGRQRVYSGQVVGNTFSGTYQYREAEKSVSRSGPFSATR